MKGARFIHRPDGRVEIKARRKDTGRFDTVGFCHPATVPLLRKDGCKAWLHLITLPQ